MKQLQHHFENGLISRSAFRQAKAATKKAAADLAFSMPTTPTVGSASPMPSAKPTPGSSVRCSKNLASFGGAYLLGKLRGCDTTINVTDDDGDDAVLPSAAKKRRVRPVSAQSVCVCVCTRVCVVLCALTTTLLRHSRSVL